MHRRLLVDPTHPEPRALAPAAAALDAGAVVAFPTETVYGLGARADEAGRAALARMKGRPPAQPFALLLADAAELSDRAGLGALPEAAARLAERYWPGPLTLVVRDSRPDAEPGAWLGVRVAGHPVARALLRAARTVVCATSANPHGAPPACDAAEVAARFAGAGELLIVDGGPAALGEASSVVACGEGAFAVLRAGAIALAALTTTARLRVGFLCAGNTCRSPIAAAILSATMAAAAQTLPGRPGWEPQFEVVSAGLDATPGAPASPEAIAAMAAWDAEPWIAEHRATLADAAWLGRCDFIYAMTARQVERAGQLAPEVRARIAQLDPGGRDIADPLGKPAEVYWQTARQLERAVLARCLPRTRPRLPPA